MLLYPDCCGLIMSIMKCSIKQMHSIFQVSANLSNGHARHGSLDTPSESTTSVSSPSSLASPSHAGPSPSLASPPNVEIYDVKFIGMQCGGQDAPGKEISPLATPSNEGAKDNDVEQTDTAVVPEPTPQNAESAGQEEEALTEEVEDISAVVEDIQKEVEGLKEVIASENDVVIDDTIASPPPVGRGHSKEPSTEGHVFSKEASPSSEGPSRRRSHGDSFSKRDLADVINQAATRRRRESSADSE